MRFNTPSQYVTQKLVLDEETFELAFLKCPMCRERYTLSSKSPRLLPCHHTYCLECIRGFYKKEQEYKASIMPSISTQVAMPIMCPNCSLTFITSIDGINQLSMDHRIVQLLDFVGSTEKHDVTYCSKHATQCLNFFCERCKQSVCRDCTVLDHKKCVEAKMVLDMKSAKEKYTPIVEKAAANMATEIESLKEKRKTCEEALSKCQDGDQTIITDIKQSFEKLRQALNEREKAILAQVKSSSGTGKEDVEEKIKRMDDKEKEASEIVATVNAFKDFDNLPKLYSQYEKIQNYETEPALEKDSIKTEAPKSKFINRDEGTLVVRLEKYGELQSQDKSYNGTSSYSSTSSAYTSGGMGSSYGSYGSSRYSGTSGSAYTGTSGSSYTSRYTPRTSYRY